MLQQMSYVMDNATSNEITIMKCKKTPRIPGKPRALGKHQLETPKQLKTGVRTSANFEQWLGYSTCVLALPKTWN